VKTWFPNLAFSNGNLCRYASAGYTPVNNSLFHHARAALKQFTPESSAPGFPHPGGAVQVENPVDTHGLFKAPGSFNPRT
jgi:hypothetical protein